MLFQRGHSTHVVAGRAPTERRPIGSPIGIPVERIPLAVPVRVHRYVTHLPWRVVSDRETPRPLLRSSPRLRKRDALGPVWYSRYKPKILWHLYRSVLLGRQGDTDSTVGCLFPRLRLSNPNQRSTAIHDCPNAGLDTFATRLTRSLFAIGRVRERSARSFSRLVWKRVFPRNSRDYELIKNKNFFLWNAAFTRAS